MFLTVVAGRLACMFLKYAGEIASGAEAQRIADLIHRGLGICQQVLCPFQLQTGHKQSVNSRSACNPVSLSGMEIPPFAFIINDFSETDKRQHPVGLTQGMLPPSYRIPFCIY